MTNPHAQAIGAYLKKLRKLRGLERSEVAQAAGICAHTLANMEEARGADLRYLQLRRVLAVLGGDIVDLELLLSLPTPDLRSAETLAYRRTRQCSSVQGMMRETVVIQLAGGFLTSTLRGLATYRCPWRLRPGTRLYEGLTANDADILLINGEPLDTDISWRTHANASLMSCDDVGLRALAVILLDQEFQDAPRTAACVLARDVLMPLRAMPHWVLSSAVLHEWATLWALVQSLGHTA